MSKFWELVEQSIIFQGLLTLIIVGAWVYMLVTGKPVPNELHAAAGIVMGFFFGAKQSIFARKEAQRIEAQKEEIRAATVRE